MYNKQHPVSLLIIEDHLLMQEGIRSLLANNPDIALAGSFTHGLEALAFLETQPADVVLLDISLPDISGIELCRRIRQLDKSIRILALSASAERTIILQMLQNGANGYMLKNTSSAALTDAIKQLIDKRIVLGADVQEILAAGGSPGPGEIPHLTRREKEVLRLIAGGLTNPQIASTLAISILTAETHRKNIMQKLKVNNAAALIKAAIDYSLL
ncbi:DNA-binding response regulator [Chitinophaga lutea]|uniref:DNA-binding response regulator n=1 Tax=Chitinophaga lutea TaxID=2488634 RepID=A0A3N4Q3G9_9BACT|nr:response regulator transcription factor [Chitinophaga lutea]RPE14125.1 DNA-binding response regulator [Chitinophaga lutea]